MRPPLAPQRPHVWQRPTGSVEDPWAWLAERDDPATLAYLEAENDYAEHWLAGHAETVDAIFGEIRRRVRESDLSAPVPYGDWWYVTRTEEGQAYPIHCRGRRAERAADHVILDENAEAKGFDYFDLGAFEISPDHRYVAWSFDARGDEHYSLRIRRIDDAVDLGDELRDTTWGGVAWSSDGTHLFYVTADAQERPCHVWRHRVGTPQSEDVQILSEADERFFVGLHATRSGEWIVVHAASKCASEAWMLPAADPCREPLCVRAREDGIEYEIDHWGDRFVVLTNLDALDFRIMEAPLSAPGQWSERIPHEPGCRRTEIQPFAEYLAVHEWFAAQPQVRIVHRDGSSHVLRIASEPHDVGFGANEVWTATTLRVVTESLTTPRTVFDVDVRSGERTLVRRVPTPHVELDRYVATREWASAADGTQVPVDIVRRRDTPADGSAPGLLYGYGAYEVSMAPWFSVARLSFLDRGGVWALVHPRGGGELGRRWYLEGKLQHKQNTFGDTLAVAEHLVERGWCAPDRLALRGGSAGGLLVGACVTQAPGRFACAVAEMPFVDVVNTVSDPSRPLSVTEWEEWGDPRTEPYASYVERYSPYDNTVPAAYPALYLTTGWNDPRVSYHEPAKWAAKLRHVRSDARPLLLRTEMGAGHAGPSGRYDAWREEARVLAFVLATT